MQSQEIGLDEEKQKADQLTLCTTITVEMWISEARLFWIAKPGVYVY